MNDFDPVVVDSLDAGMVRERVCECCGHIFRFGWGPGALPRLCYACRSAGCTHGKQSPTCPYFTKEATND